MFVFTQAGAKKWGTDESMFNRILCTLSHAQLRLVFEEYKKISGGKSIEQAINNEMSGDLKEGMLAIVLCSQSKTDFYATRLYKAMKVGVGKVGTRPGCDLGMVGRNRAMILTSVAGGCSGVWVK